MTKPTFQAIITRLPYEERFDAAPIIEAAKNIDDKGLICISMPIHLENPNNGGILINQLEEAGLILCAKVAWSRDRHIATKSSKRLTNMWEPLAIFAKVKNHSFNREAPSKYKKDFENRETAFDDDLNLCCIGDHWIVSSGRSDIRTVPQGVVINCAQLADLQPNDTVLDIYPNSGIKQACELFGWNYEEPKKIRKSKKQT